MAGKTIKYRGEESNGVIPGFILVQVLRFRGRSALAADVELLAFDAYIGAGRNRHGNERVAADDGVVTDDCFAAQNGSAGVNGHIVLDGRMAFLAAQVLSAPGR